MITRTKISCVIRNFVLVGAIFLTPLMVIVYPFWIRFSDPASSWEYVAWVLLAAYPICIVLSVIQLFRGRIFQACAYATPIILTVVFFVFPSCGDILSPIGFRLYRISHKAEFTQCTLANFSQDNKQFVVGPCLEAANQDIPGFDGERDFIIYDTSGLIAKPMSKHTVPWKEAVEQYVDVFGYADYYVQKIGDDYFYVSFDMGSYGPAFNSNF